MATAALVGAPILLLSWCSLTARPATKILPAGANLWTYGFTTIKDNVGLLYAKYHQLFRFLMVFAVIDAGRNSLLSLVIIYLKEQLCMPTERSIMTAERGITDSSFTSATEIETCFTDI